MMHVLSWTLRMGVVALLILPLVVPTVSTTGSDLVARQITIVSNRASSPNDRSRAIAIVRDRFGSQSQVTFQNLSNENAHPAQTYDAVGQAVRGLKDVVVLDLDESLWGDTAVRFNQRLLETDAARTERLYRLAPSKSQAGPASFLLIADLYVPKVSFLGEETLAVAEIAGRLAPGTQETIEILVRSNGDLVTTERRTITASSDGIIKSVVEVPVSFIKAQSQVITVEMRSPQALHDYDRASTTVFVAHNKTTVLHVAVGPDWSLRTMRQKLKFWPNLDLLSYYILRERWDDNSIPQSQLSLIEFPSDKLFGEQLPNFHGIVSQNFYFDHYLAQRDALNLVNYVQEGGRMFLQAGPLSFLSKDPAIQSLFPCANQPTQTTYESPQSWRAAKGSAIQLPEELSESLPYIKSQIGFKGCEAKKGAFVLAELAGGDPVLFAQNLGKGLVVTALSADWHTQSVVLAAAATGDVQGERSAAIMEVNLQTTATERLSTWIVEFLQRRQDSGLRAPDLAGPRLTTQDRFLLTRSRGGFRQDAEVVIRGDSEKDLIARSVQLPFLEREGLALPASLGSILTNKDEGQFSSLGLVVRSPDQSDEDTNSLLRGGRWPVAPPPGEPMPPNPQLLAQVPTLDSSAPLQSMRDRGERRDAVTERPLIEAYPWLMALGLALLCLDTLATIMRRTTRPSAGEAEQR